ncbi:MAG TPA: sigma 54-interacting transcriptional regulator [Kofleriaceae bacterium]|nr:sigma 54-interacting transcriptional regulator [Kofleriaceae bacterium]
MTPDRRRVGNVVALRDQTTGEVFELDERRRWVVGSSPSCDFTVRDPFVSSRHCLIERRPGGSVVVRDNDSRNGTFLDGNPIEAAELRVGAHLRVGRTTLVAVAASGGGERPTALESLRGHDPVLRATVEQAVRAAPTDCSMLILGETGTGKDLLARVIHEASRRADGPFVAVNCGAIPRELIASELFGHEKGSFTGAADSRDGYFIEANNGTLFLDEIGELPIELQPNLLRALEAKRVRRVGGHSDRAIDVRIVAATNRTEGLGTESSRMRLDLYHRLATVVLSLPPLRERIADLGELVEAMLQELAPEFGAKHVSDEAWMALAGYGWPGNVRELRHAIARAVALGGDELGPRDFFPDAAMRQRLSSTTPPLIDVGAIAPYQVVLRGAMEQALQTHGTIRAAAASLGMPKSTFADRMKTWQLHTRRKPRLPLGRTKAAESED